MTAKIDTLIRIWSKLAPSNRPLPDTTNVQADARVNATLKRPERIPAVVPQGTPSRTSEISTDGCIMGQ